MKYPKWHRLAGQPLSDADAEAARIMARDDEDLDQPGTDCEMRFEFCERQMDERASKSAAERVAAAVQQLGDADTDPILLNIDAKLILHGDKPWVWE